VVRVHPEIGEPALLLGGFAQRLVGHSLSESVDLIRILQAYVTRPENIVRWHWQEGVTLPFGTIGRRSINAIADYGSERRRCSG